MKRRKKTGQEGKPRLGRRNAGEGGWETELEEKGPAKGLQGFKRRK